MERTLSGNSSNLVECFDCGIMYCIHCQHTNCPGGRYVPDGTTGPDIFMDGKKYREHLEDQDEFVRKYQNHQ